MSVLNAVKHASINVGLYRPARWLSRHIKPRQLKLLHDDVRFYRGVLVPNAMCFDIGANVGEKSEAMLLAGAKSVVSFEPSPFAARELSARCAHYQNWRLVESALGSRAEIAVLYGSGEDSGKSSLVKGWTHTVVDTYYVPVITLDAVISCFGRPDYCKIDVEGWEPEVFKGLSESIPLLSFEFHLNEVHIPKTRASLERLAQLGSGVVNVTPAETPRFYFDDWIPLEDFLHWFPGNLKREMPGDPYGDIWVKSTDCAPRSDGRVLSSG